jgi:transcriptional regulator with XRE-family HTH domain
MSITVSDLGNEIARARRAKRLSQTELGVAAGLARQTISALERGVITDLGIKKLMRLLEVLDLELVVRAAGHPVTLDDLRPRSR